MITRKEIHELTHEVVWQWKKVIFKTGKLAPHCDGAVEMTIEGTTLLITAVMEKNPDLNKGWFPLSIEYRESYYAAGKIGGWRFRKREWRPSDDSVLYARLTDRPLRPMFPKWMVNDVVLTISPLQIDKKHSPGEMSIIGSSLATLLAGIPFAGPVGAIRIGHINGEFVMNMTDDQAAKSIMDLHVAGTKTEINMLEAGGNETPMDIIKKGLELAQVAIKEICEIQEQFVALHKITEQTITTNNPANDLITAVKEAVGEDNIANLFGKVEKGDWDRLYNEYEALAKEKLVDICASDENDRSAGHIGAAWFTVVKKAIRKKTLEEGIRIDGRTPEQIRKIYCETDMYERVHGTGFFRRGETQVLSLLTLGSPADVEFSDDMENDQAQARWIHHYKMPPFSNNEARMIRFTNRREIGHGKLAEKAIEPMLPDAEDFPYTMRIVSEVLGAGGSTSMASVCGSTLALLSGWVPMKKPVSGIAMWLMKDGDTELVLTDIKGTEDFVGDMDFKLAGTDEGMTAIQMDTKLKGIGVAKLQEMLDRAQVGRTDILAFMNETISKAKADISPYAPYLLKFKVQADQVREIIGKWGSTIQEIVRETGAKIDLEDDGSGVIAGENKAMAQAAMDWINKVLWVPQKWDQMDGTITRVEKYGVFVDIGSKKTGLCHVKQLGSGYIEDVTALFNVGEPIKVEVIEIDNMGKIALKKVESPAV